MSDQEQLDITLEIAGIFDSLEIRYLLGGSMASSFHGIHRSTNDSDFVAEFPSEKIRAFCEALGDDYYVAEEAVKEAVDLNRSFNAIHMATALKIDVFIMKSDSFSQSQMKRRVPVTIETDKTSGSIYVASPEDTVLAKLDWYRLGGKVSERHITDILGVIKTQGVSNMDFDYIRESADHLGLREMFEKLLDDADF